MVKGAISKVEKELINLKLVFIFIYIYKVLGKIHKKEMQDFPDGSVVKNLPANTWDTGWIPGLGRYHIPRGN